MTYCGSFSLECKAADKFETIEAPRGAADAETPVTWARDRLGVTVDAYKPPTDQKDIHRFLKRVQSWNFEPSDRRRRGRHCFNHPSTDHTSHGSRHYTWCHDCDVTRGSSARWSKQLMKIKEISRGPSRINRRDERSMFSFFPVNLYSLITSWPSQAQPSPVILRRPRDPLAPR